MIVQIIPHHSEAPPFLFSFFEYALDPPGVRRWSRHADRSTHSEDRLIDEPHTTPDSTSAKVKLVCAFYQRRLRLRRRRRRFSIAVASLFSVSSGSATLLNPALIHFAMVEGQKYFKNRTVRKYLPFFRNVAYIGSSPFHVWVLFAIWSA